MQQCKVLANMQVKTKNGSSPDVRGWAPSVGTLWRSVGVRDGQRLSIGISRALAKTASIAGGFKSWGDNSRPAWVSLGEGWGKEGRLSITLAKPHTAVGDTGGVSVDSGSNTISIAKSISQGLGRPLAISTLWGSVAVRDGWSWVGSNAWSPNWSPWLSRPLAKSLRGPVAVRNSSGVCGNTTAPQTPWGPGLSIPLLDSLHWESPDSLTNIRGAAIGMECLSWGLLTSRPFAISALWGPVAVGDSSWVGSNAWSPDRSPWLSRPLAKSLWGPVAVGDSGWVSGNARSPQTPWGPGLWLSFS